jgi:phage tail sheath protein FI
VAETFSLSELIVPGTYVRVLSEGLIGVGGIPTGNIGVVGTVAAANTNTGTTAILSDYATAQDLFGAYDALTAGTLNLTRSIEQLYLNGAGTVFARALPLGAANAQPTQDDYVGAFRELIKEQVNILVAPQLPTDDAKAIFGTILEEAENAGHDLIAVIGSDKTAVADIVAQAPTNDRIIFTTPGVQAFDSAAKKSVTLPGNYSAAAVAGLLSTLVPQSSPTNKSLPGVTKLAKKYAYGELKTLLGGRVMVLEERGDVRVVRGLTTDNGAFKQVTTRRIVDFAKAGIRQASDPFIGRLNNQRVRAALAGAINGFLTTMVQDEALISYTLDVSATRQDEINGRAIVNAILAPTFSIDFIAVTLVLQ